MEIAKINGRYQVSSGMKVMSRTVAGYGRFVGALLSCLGFAFALKDDNGKTFYLNRKSAIKALQQLGEKVDSTIKSKEIRRLFNNLFLKTGSKGSSETKDEIPISNVNPNPKAPSEAKDEIPINSVNYNPMAPPRAKDEILTNNAKETVIAKEPEVQNDIEQEKLLRSTAVLQSAKKKGKSYLNHIRIAIPAREKLEAMPELNGVYDALIEGFLKRMTQNDLKYTKAMAAIYCDELTSEDRQELAAHKIQVEEQKRVLYEQKMKDIQTFKSTIEAIQAERKLSKKDL